MMRVKVSQMIRFPVAGDEVIPPLFLEWKIESESLCKNTSRTLLKSEYYSIINNNEMGNFFLTMMTL